MDDMNEALINGEMLRWARERRALDYGQVAKATKIKIVQLEQWETGLSYPPFGKAELLAKTLNIPFGFLFLSKIPSDASPISDFRTIDGKRPSNPSPDLLSVINQARTKQEWYREFSEGNGAPPLAIVGALSMDSGVKAVADAISEALPINEEIRHQVDNHSSYLTRLSDAVQETGILVMRSGIVGGGSKNRLSVKEFRGLALADPYAPLVFINSRDAHSAQIFTLIHEVAHIWINRTGISNPDPMEDAHEGVERFCNSVAAEALVPKPDFLVAWDELKDHHLFPATLARRFWVSPLVVILRAYESNKIGEDEFFRLVKIEKNKIIRIKKSTGGNPIRNMVARNGRRLTNGVLSAVRENRLVYRDAERVLGIRSNGLNTLLRKYVS